MNQAVYVDFDDVLCETARTLAEIVAKRFGKQVAFEDIRSFELEHSFGLDVTQQEVLFALFHDPEVLAMIPAVPGAIAGMRQWHDAGCRIEIVTGRPPETQGASCAWLDAHSVPYEGITFVDKYSRGHGLVPGVRQLQMQELETSAYALVVDDSPAMIRFFAEKTRHELVLLDRPWNRGLSLDGTRPGVRRCRGWSELLEAHPAPGVNE